jgi:putative endonuclease
VNPKALQTPKLKTTRAKGQHGENLACEYLNLHHFKILDRNFYFSKNAEIDIIAIRLNTLRFIEVKSSFKKDLPGLWVTPLKQKRIYKAAQAWLQRHPKYQSSDMQFDVITLQIKDQDSFLKHYSNAFIPYL